MSSAIACPNQLKKYLVFTEVERGGVGNDTDLRIIYTAARDKAVYCTFRVLQSTLRFRWCRFMVT